MQFQRGIWYTGKEVDAGLKISPTTRWRMKKRGVLVPHLFGDTERYKGDDILHAGKKPIRNAT